MSTEFEITVLASLSEIKTSLASVVSPAPAPLPAEPSIWVRPAPGTPRHGEGRRMTSADVVEATQRALSCIDYQGNRTRGDEEENRIWEVIEKLKGQKWADIAPYVALNEDLAYFGLLTSLIQSVDEVPFTESHNIEKRRQLAKKASGIQNWLDQEFHVAGVVSGG
ncbi:MAG: hypothetical protein WC969_14740 [Elusimicrobiota bacterium]|jgi:hypothetical protein